MNRIKYMMRDLLSYIISYRLLLFVLLQALAMHNGLRNLITASRTLHYPISMWIFPLLFVQLYVQFIYGIAVVNFFSTAPFFQYNQLYVVLRQGRFRWATSKCLRIIISSGILVALNFILSIILIFPHVEVANDWGKLLYSLAMTELATEYSIDWIPYSLIGVDSVGVVTVKHFVILFLVTMMIGFLMFTLSLLFSKMVAVIIGTSIPILTIVSMNVFRVVRPVFWFSPLTWSNLTVLNGTLSSNHPTFLQAIVVVSIICVICIFLIYFKIMNIDFEWSKDE